MIDDFRPAPRPTKSLQENTNNLKAEQTFSTPLQTAAADDVATAPETVAETTDKQSAAEVPVVPDFNNFEAPAPTGRWAKLRAHWPPTKRQSIVAGGIALLVLSGGGAAFALLSKPDPVVTKPVVKVKKAPAPVVPTTVASALSGLQVDPAINTKPVIGVMIENSLAARPQAGLGSASVVFEAIAEGGITRFLALYQDTNPAEVGPIRSVRPYYLHWGMGFDAAIAHVGGSPEALNGIKAWGTRDLDQFFNSGAYHRTAAKQAPHNVYSSVDTFTQLAQSKGFASSTFTSWLRKQEAASNAVNARSIDMAISGPLYNTHYDYDAASNSYKRSMGGQPHVDSNGGAQISPKVVIALVMPYSIQADGKHSEYGTVGSGQAYIFQDGLVTLGNWNKADIKAPISFTDAAGQPLPLNPGQTWLTAIGAANKVTSAP